MSEKKKQVGCVVIQIEKQGLNGEVFTNMVQSTLKMRTAIDQLVLGQRLELDNTIHIVLDVDTAGDFAILLNRFGIRSSQVYGALVAEEVIKQLKNIEN
ncbi:hypothetical protein JW758_03640 [Candidatus Peregrinibacteria bacterium]|nr:hypothetical protein [Candidatus Peregrinibacteria bacterium]